MVSPSDADDTDSDEPLPSDPPPKTTGPQVVYEFAVAADDLVFGEAFREFPDVTVECELQVPTNQNPLPHLWMADGEVVPHGFVDAIRADTQVDAVRKVHEFEDGALCHLTWAPRAGSLFEWLSERGEGNALLAATATDGTWYLKLRFPSRERLAEFRAFSETRGYDLDLVRLFEVSQPKRGEYDITRKQRDAILRAQEMGYWAIPRETTLEAVAESLGISTKSLSERLRRGQTNLVTNTLTIGHASGLGLEEK